MGTGTLALRTYFARIRSFLGKNRRTAIPVAALAALGLVAAIAASWGITSKPGTTETQLTSSVMDCHDMVTISVAGRNDTPVSGTTAMLVDRNGNELPAALSGDHKSEWLDPVVNAGSNAVGSDSNAAIYIAYPANLNSEEAAVTAGVANTEKVMREISSVCPNTKYSIVGYSEGSDVVRRVAMQIGNSQTDIDPDKVLGVVILADPGRKAGDGTFIGAQDPNHPDNFDTNYGGKGAGGQGALPDTGGDFGKLNGKIASFCSDGDLTCSAPQNISLLQLAINVGRQINVDSLQNDGLTPATGQDVAVKLGDIALKAFQYIGNNPNWMKSDETFLQVLLKVSAPTYKPGAAAVTAGPVSGGNSVATNDMSPLAYLPQKVFNEIVGLIVTNTNTIPVILSDPYQQTLGPDHTGHHFDYWKDADQANGKPLTSAEYAAAWLTHLAQQAQKGEPVTTTAKPEPADLAAAYKAAKPTVEAAPTTTTSPTKASGTTTPGSTTPATTTPGTTTPGTTTPAPVTTTPTTPAPTTVAPTTTDSVLAQAPVTTTPPTTTAPTTTTTVPPTTTVTTTPNR
ncbi:cutinase family protein [Nocardia sp. NPDC058058]|uniref:cutinase family protein n=1 Tax=Nocardia sp. NPDC058058 TaxID=3346317 RepID=UPI0036DE29C4